MAEDTEISGIASSQVPVVDLSTAPGERSAWDRPKAVIFLWAVFELLFVTNPWQPSSLIRTRVLRLFGADIGSGVVFRPRTRVKFPWKLHIGDRCWIGEGVWFHNQEHIFLGSDVVVSQESFITTGSHAHRRDMALLTSPIQIEDGVWVTTRCIVLGGTVLGRSALIKPLSVVSGDVPANAVVGAPASSVIGQRFPEGDRQT